MSDDGCAEMRLLVQADVDGALTPAEAARVAVHVDGCAACADVQARLVALGVRLRREAPSYPASAALRSAVRTSIANLLPPGPRARATVPAWRRWFGHGAAFAAGAALAAAVALAVVPSPGEGFSNALAASHIRALQPGHLMDVASTDQHTVKPWFDGRLDFSPPVMDFAAAGFPLRGGRLDYVAGRPAAVLVYQRRQHVIDVYVWPEASAPRVISSGTRNGYNMRHWRYAGMVFWAISDLNAAELRDFAGLWK